MKKAYVFPGQGAQFTGMGLSIYNNRPELRKYFEKANEILNFSLTDIMFKGTDEELKQTKVTQPAIFLHSVLVTKAMGEDFLPDMVAGHSLGEFSALVAAQAISFEDGLKLVAKRAFAMQEACEKTPSTMAAVLGITDDVVIKVCSEIKEHIVVPANFNCPGQIVISGTIEGINIACEQLKEQGAKRAIPLKVGGAFHSPLMESAREDLAKAIEETEITTPICPIYQNVTAKPVIDPTHLKRNLINQLTSPVRWTETIQNMVADGATHFVECGPGKVLQGMIKKIASDAVLEGHEE